MKNAFVIGRQDHQYEVTKGIVLNDKEYKKITENFSTDQTWMTEEDGGINEKGEFLYIKVKCEY